jgi:hypothetical protein
MIRFRSLLGFFRTEQGHGHSSRERFLNLCSRVRLSFLGMPKLDAVLRD